jgi:hypothetical protein
MSVVDAVAGELESLGGGAAGSALAATALALARELDDPETRRRQEHVREGAGRRDARVAVVGAAAEGER